MAKVLIIEDEPNMVLGLKDSCEYEGYEVSVARDGKEGLEKATTEKPDIILLDLMLPLMSGKDVCRTLRNRGIQTPILMLTARNQDIDKVVGFEVGADDYVTKPFSIMELLARIRAHLRRAAKQVVDIESFAFGDVELDFKKYAARKGGRVLDLSPREFEILRYLIRRRGEIVTRDELLDEVWGYGSNPVTRTVDNHIAKLRQKIERDPSAPQHIITVHRLGYRFVE
ncbi:MAG TPA: response regulator transcription factor [Pyrinomonadaceae bacterium]|nr:response regulator transcription factor [Pyrinomonadaceae bacterium]